ncbi:MAG: hypothetical protein AAFY71_18260 [Bacteroidota bacterium]
MNRKDFFVLMVRLILGYVFFSSGLCKLTHGNFGQIIGPPTLIEDLQEYGLAGFGYLVAISQVLFGALIFTQRFSLLGLIGLVPMNISILAFTLSQGWTGTPYVNFFMLLLNLIALLYEWPSLRVLVWPYEEEKRLLPHSIRLFDEASWAFGLLALASLAMVVGMWFYPMATILGCIFFTVTAVFLVKSQDMSLWELGVLACFFLSILSITLAKQLYELGLNAMIAFIVFLGLGLGIYLLSFFFKRKPIQLIS